MTTLWLVYNLWIVVTHTLCVAFMNCFVLKLGQALISNLKNIFPHFHPYKILSFCLKYLSSETGRYSWWFTSGFFKWPEVNYFELVLIVILESNMPNENLTPSLPLLHSTSVNLSEQFGTRTKTNRTRILRTQTRTNTEQIYFILTNTFIQ